MKKALITGITGQDGSYLAEFLLEKGYEVHGVIRRSSSFNTERIDHIFDRLILHYGDLSGDLTRLLLDIDPDEVYNLGAQSHVKVSFEIPEYTGDITGLGVTRLLETIKTIDTKIKLYQASSSEMFGASPPPQDENTPFNPMSPYGAAKVYAYHMTKNYREAYKIFICNGILFNHESPRRGETFVTRKITRAATRIKMGLQDELVLGNLNAQRDWGYAGDYVYAMWLMMQQNISDDYVIATGRTYSIRDFVETVFGILDLDWKLFVRVDDKYFRPTEVNSLCGDASKANKKLGWTPRVSMQELAKMMIKSDMKLAEKEKRGER